ncbi:uncharacterized protein LOC135195431 [Macrobrachium nipponense]|uniref:uncharacterized protein LOC135195431 n=1 Tax=Macrobrachium nipponense TaxID=159736 RepID=UPI0030C82FB0
MAVPLDQSSAPTSMKIVLGVLLILICGDVQLTRAAKKCVFNGQKFASGDLVLRIDDACTSFYCQAMTKKNGKQMKNKVEIVARTDPMDACQCNIAPRYITDPRKMLNEVEAQHKNYRMRRAKDQPTLKSKSSSHDRHGTRVELRKKKKPRQNMKRCKFNQRKYKAGQTILSVPERCMDLACVKQSGTVSLIQAQLKSGCTCSDQVTGPPSTSPGQVPSTSPPPQCSDYREKFTSSHSMCQPKSTTCNIKKEGITEQEKNKILKLHNEYRAKVARGEEDRGNPGPQPSATNMREIVWRQELGDVAQAWANTCPTGHDCTDCRKILSQDYYVGQNLFWSWSFNDSEQWDLAITSFYDEVKDVPKSLVDNYQSIITANPIGHYTQLVWAETYEVGCGAMIHGPCSSGLISFEVCKIYACNYGPGGNYISKPIYEAGDTASSCPNGKSSKYDGLCK